MSTRKSRDSQSLELGCVSETLRKTALDGGGDNYQEVPRRDGSRGEIKEEGGERQAGKRCIAMYAQEPLFTSLDVRFLASLGVTVVSCSPGGRNTTGGDDISSENERLAHGSKSNDPLWKNDLITPSTFVFAPFLEHAILLDTVLQPCSQSSSKLISDSYAKSSNSNSNDATNINREACPITGANSRPGHDSKAALYIGTNIDDVLDAVDRSRAATHNDHLDSDFETSRKQQRRRQKQQRQEQQRQRQSKPLQPTQVDECDALRQNSNDRQTRDHSSEDSHHEINPDQKATQIETEADKLSQAAHTFTASRSTVPFPQFESYPLAFAGMWIYYK